MDVDSAYGCVRGILFGPCLGAEQVRNDIKYQMPTNSFFIDEMTMEINKQANKQKKIHNTASHCIVPQIILRITWSQL